MLSNVTIVSTKQWDDVCSQSEVNMLLGTGKKNIFFLKKESSLSKFLRGLKINLSMDASIYY